MSQNAILMMVVFLMVGSVLVLFVVVMSSKSDRIDSRLNRLARPNDPTFAEPDAMAQFARTTLPKMGQSLMPEDEGQRTKLRARLVNAGFYHRQAMAAFLGVKMLLMVSPPLLGLIAGLTGLFNFQWSVLVGTGLGIVGMIGPSFWLDQAKKKRQTQLRRSLPDALDVIVICLDGGLSLPAALQRVSAELATAHPLLSSELKIVQREVQLGRSAGEALWHLAERSGLEEVLSLSSVIQQADKFGASLVKSLRTHSDQLRHQRKQRAEELAQKAGTKILFPTLLFIFPAMFVVVLGPAAVRVSEMLDNMNR